MYENIPQPIETKPQDPSELFGDMDRFEYIKILGQGAYGVVW